MFDKKLKNLIERVEQKKDYLASIRQTQLGQVHRFILKTLSEGKEVNVEELAQQLELSPEIALKHLQTLHENDIIKFKEREVKSAYPFAAKTTQHKLSIDGNTAYALCAIDALGVPFMLNKDIAIESSCTYCEQPVTVKFNSLKAKAMPANSVVWIPLVKTINRASDDICPRIDFFCSQDHASSWQTKVSYDGVTLDLKKAIDLGKYFFGDFLNEN